MKYERDLRIFKNFQIILFQNCFFLNSKVEKLSIFKITQIFHAFRSMKNKLTYL